MPYHSNPTMTFEEFVATKEEITRDQATARNIIYDEYDNEADSILVYLGCLHIGKIGDRYLCVIERSTFGPNLRECEEALYEWADGEYLTAPPEERRRMGERNAIELKSIGKKMFSWSSELFVDNIEVSDIEDNFFCRLTEEEAAEIYKRWKYDVWGNPRINMLPYSIIEEAARKDDVNAACIIIQDAINQKDGGVAGIYFSEHTALEDGNTKEWKYATLEEREKMILGYIDLELSYAETKPFRFLKSLSAETNDTPIRLAHAGAGQPNLGDDATAIIGKCLRDIHEAVRKAEAALRMLGKQ